MPRSKQFRGFLLSLSVAASIGALAACSSDGGSSATKTAAPMPPITEMDAAMNAPAPQPLALSESDTLTPVGGTTTSVTTTTTTAMLGDTVETRIAKLEQTVGSLRTDYNRIMPAFASLNTTNERIQTLLDEIEKETGNRPAGSVSAAAPMAPEAPAAQTTASLATPPMANEIAGPAKAAVTKGAIATVSTPAPETKPMEKSAEAAPAAGGNMVTAVRIGEHGSKTRLVMDLTAKTKPDFKYDLDNAEKLLLVDLPSSGWGGAESGKPKSPIIESWSVQKGPNGGSSLAIQLKKNARILSTEFLKAEGKDPARLVMDIASGS